MLGENISQTAQFVQSGNADIGIIALSLALAPDDEGQGQDTSKSRRMTIPRSSRPRWC